MQNLRVRLPAMAAEEVEYLRDKTAKLSGADVKARQSSKIRELGEALITAGFVSLDAQARVLGLPRSTAWTILSANHKSTGISAKIIRRMLSSEPLPQLVRAKIIQYGGKSSRYLWWDEDSAPQICLETQSERIAPEIGHPLAHNGRVRGPGRRAWRGGSADVSAGGGFVMTIRRIIVRKGRHQRVHANCLGQPAERFRQMAVDKDGVPSSL